MPSGRPGLTRCVLHLNTTATLRVSHPAFQFWELRVQKRTRKQGKSKKAKGKSSRSTELAPQYDMAILLLPFAFVLLPSSVIHHPTVPQLDDPVSVGGIHFRVRNLNDSRA